MAGQNQKVSRDSNPGPDWVCLGHVAGVVGVRGEIKIKPYTETPESVASYGPVTFYPGMRRVTVKVVRSMKDGLALRVDGVADRTAAEALKGLRLYVLRSVLPEIADEDDFYHADLIGLRVEDEAGVVLGTVKAIHDFGAGDVLEVTGGDKPLLLSFTKAVVPVVDIKGGRVVVSPPESDPESDDEPDHQMAETEKEGA